MFVVYGVVLVIILPARRPAISNGEESVFCSTAVLLSWFISADFYPAASCPDLRGQASNLVNPKNSL
jgi:hypothetical protein